MFWKDLSEPGRPGRIAYLIDVFCLIVSFGFIVVLSAHVGSQHRCRDLSFNERLELSVELSRADRALEHIRPAFAT